tara:strand:+ start:1037 stop:1642 length:606 start_codon:yes stop_codon:yes gene_type:complete
MRYKEKPMNIEKVDVAAVVEIDNAFGETDNESSEPIGSKVDAKPNGTAEGTQHMNVLTEWVDKLTLDHCHKMFSEAPHRCCVFMMLGDYDFVPEKWKKYVCVVYPAVTVVQNYEPENLKVYIARKEKAREMWANFVEKNTTAKTVADLKVLENGHVTDSSVNINNISTAILHQRILKSIQTRLIEFVEQARIFKTRPRNGI